MENYLQKFRTCKSWKIMENYLQKFRTCKSWKIMENYLQKLQKHVKSSSSSNQGCLKLSDLFKRFVSTDFEHGVLC